MKKQRLPRKAKKKWKKMGVIPVFSLNIPPLTDEEIEKIVKAFKEYRTMPLKLVPYDE